MMLRLLSLRRYRTSLPIHGCCEAYDRSRSTRGVADCADDVAAALTRSRQGASCRCRRLSSLELPIRTCYLEGVRLARRPEASTSSLNPRSVLMSRGWAILGSSGMNYRVTNYANPSAELARLQVQAAMLRDLECEAFVHLGLPAAGRVLEVGCGPGYFASQLAARLPNLTMFGVDVDEVCVTEARNRIPVLKADARALPVRDGSLDAAYARFALRHIAQPERALSAAYSALRPGGRILIEEVDNSSHIVFPELPLFEKVLAARHQTMRRSGGDPYIGRRVLALLRCAGFVGIQSVSIPVCSLQIGRERFADVVLSAFSSATTDEVLSADELRGYREQIADWTSSDDAFGHTTILVFGGQRPH